MTRMFLAVATALALAAPAAAVETGVTINLSNELGDASLRSVLYSCSDGEPFYVRYIDAAPNFLAVVPLPEVAEPLVFAGVVSPEQDTRYAAAHFQWRVTGPDATLVDADAPADAEPLLTCAELNNTP